MKLLVIQHVPHERLGTFEQAFTAAGCRPLLLHADDRKAIWPGVNDVDGIVSMGGPMSVYQRLQYPWIAKELALLRQAVKADRPVLGVCLGAQLLAAALGGKVSAAPQKEIGWHPVMREPGADGDPVMASFGQTETVFQWHGDTYTLPTGAVRLASSPLCPEQGFRYGARAYAVQFHLEVTEPIIRAWMRVPVNRAELATLNRVIDPMTIRRQIPQHVDRLKQLSREVATAFCHLLPTRSASHARS